AGLGGKEEELGLGERGWRMLMGGGKRKLASDLGTDADALQLSRVMWGHNSVRGTHNTGYYEWYTPARYIELAREVLGEIDLDPASSAKAQEIVKAQRYFTLEQDGLIRPWHGRVWLNPPYHQP